MKRGSTGFTLVELLLYITIMSMMLLLISVFAVGMLEARVKHQTIAEVDGQGIQIMQIIGQVVRNAEGINTPQEGSSGSTLSIDASGDTNDPTVFDVSGNTLRITEGGGSAAALTNERVEVSNVIFRNLSRVDTPGVVQIEFTLTHANPEGRNEYAYEETFIYSAALRQ